VAVWNKRLGALAFLLGGEALVLVGQFPLLPLLPVEVDGGQAGANDDHQGQHRQRRQWRSKALVAPRPAGQPLHCWQAPGMDRLVLDEVLQVRRQLAGRLAALARLAVNGLVDDGRQVARHVGIEFA
jgi:hypothetical protein